MEISTNTNVMTKVLLVVLLENAHAVAGGNIY